MRTKRKRERLQTTISFELSDAIRLLAVRRRRPVGELLDQAIELFLKHEAGEKPIHTET
jgi:hypothetical protein